MAEMAAVAGVGFGIDGTGGAAGDYAIVGISFVTFYLYHLQNNLKVMS